MVRLWKGWTLKRPMITLIKVLFQKYWIKLVLAPKVCCFLFFLAQETSICKHKPSSLKLIKSQDFPPRRFPSKEALLWLNANTQNVCYMKRKVGSASNTLYIALIEKSLFFFSSHLGLSSNSIVHTQFF